ncbi:MAG: acyl-ACP--UDP-N-acetylglucosamine O-acyltransferase [Leptolyngbyaceae cyanobacterium SL_7_1]|nr:acyl-ACP--UDP-N-acetylglucosamine O-acyltransferase [Leptolyngbyaceae cyanobacterium SL_7_1]
MTVLIHPTAVIEPGADLHPTVQVGAYAVIGSRVKVGAGTVIGHHAVLDGWTEIGTNNQIFPGAAIGLDPQDLKYNGSLTLVQIGNNNVIREYVTIHRATQTDEATIIGNGNLLMANVHVAHNCVIEDQVILANAVALSGHVHIESRARLSGVLGVHQFVRIGRYAMVGGMTKIVRDVPPYMLVDGNPAKVRSLHQIGLRRAGLTELDNGTVYASLKKAFRLLYRSGLTFTEAIEQFSLLPENEHLHHLQQFLIASQSSGRRGLTPGVRRFSHEEEG